MRHENTSCKNIRTDCKLQYTLKILVGEKSLNSISKRRLVSFCWRLAQDLLEAYSRPFWATYPPVFYSSLPLGGSICDLTQVCATGSSNEKWQRKSFSPMTTQFGNQRYLLTLSRHTLFSTRQLILIILEILLLNSWICSRRNLWLASQHPQQNSMLDSITIIPI